MTVWLRYGLALAAALLLGPARPSGEGLIGTVLLLLIPYSWLFLLADELIARRRLRDSQVFLLGAGFSFGYGVLSKDMHGSSFLGLDWAALLVGPLEWGMFCVLWFHLLGTVIPASREQRLRGLGGWAGMVILTLWGLGLYAYKTATGAYLIERLLGPSWITADLALACGAVFCARRLWRTSALSNEPARSPMRSRRVVIAAGLQAAAGALIILTGGEISGLPTGVLVSGALGLAAKGLFFHAYLTSSLEV